MGPIGGWIEAGDPVRMFSWCTAGAGVVLSGIAWCAEDLENGRTVCAFAGAARCGLCPLFGVRPATGNLGMVGQVKLSTVVAGGRWRTVW